MNLINLIDNCRCWGGHRNPLLNKLKVYGIINQLSAWAANLILPVYFRCTRKNPKYALRPTGRTQQVIVSLTSYPVRIPELWKVIECLLRQSVQPDRIILHLTRSQIGSVESLPKELLDQRERGLEIVLCDDAIRSHTKYYYAFKQHPEDIVITVDDDIFYRTDLVETMLKYHEHYPQAIIANWVKEITKESDKYKEWPDGTVPQLSNRFLLLGVSSVLYPPHCMYKDIFNVQMIQELCLTADDVWLSCMALLAKTPIYFTGYWFGHLPVLIKNNTTLLATNNDRNQVQVDNLNRYYKQEIGIAPFIDID
jgi:hypothetical protein